MIGYALDCVMCKPCDIRVEVVAERAPVLGNGSLKRVKCFSARVQVRLKWDRVLGAAAG